MVGDFQPLSAREGRSVLNDGPFEGVPPHLDGALRSWVDSCLGDPFGVGEHRPERWERVRLRLRIPEDDLQSYLYDEGCAEDDELLDLVDAAVQIVLRPSQVDGTPLHVRNLQILLHDGGSVYDVGADRDRDVFLLVRRVSETDQQAFASAADAARESGREHAARRLSSSWTYVYGRNPDPAQAVGEAIRAVEAAATEVVSPKNSSATLGTLIRDLNQQVGKWRLAIVDQSGEDSIEPAIGMMRTVWRAHRERHEGVKPAEAVTQESAEAVVHLAVALVNWFTTGKVTRR